jgi:hypothetical protein
MRNILKWAGIFLLPVLIMVLAVPVSPAHALTTMSPMVIPLIVGATIGTPMLTLADWAKRLDPNGQVPVIVEMLSMTNEILADMLFKEGNLPTGERTTVRTGLPDVFWRLINQGVPSSKSTTAQMDEATGMLEAWSEVDVELARLNGNVSQFRLSEAQAFIESMNQEMARTLFYGNSSTEPEKFMGLAPRYSSLSAPNAENIINASGSGDDNTSIWLVVWGANTIFGVFPKGAKAGLDHYDHGEVTVETTAGIAGNRMRAYQDHWTWKCGIALRDWRYVVRIANIDVSALVANDANSPKLFQLLTKATWRIRAFGMGRAVIYVNRTVGEFLDIQAQDKVASGGQLSYSEIDGRRIMMFRGIPIHTVDALLNTEEAVS